MLYSCSVELKLWSMIRGLVILRALIQARYGIFFNSVEIKAADFTESLSIYNYTIGLSRNTSMII